MKVSSALLVSVLLSFSCAPVQIDRSTSSVAQPHVPASGLPDQLDLARALQAISGTRMLQDVARLSNPEFNGRLTGTADDRRSALWVATLFHSLGLKPAGSAALGPGNELWAQTGSVLTTQIAETRLDITAGAKTIRPLIGKGYLPILDSPSVNLNAPIAFVGYGISDPAHNFDEYHGLDVRNRIVVFLRGKPERYPQPVTQAEKERTAKEKGALAFLTLQGPILSGYETRRGSSSVPVASYTFSSGDEGHIPGCWISTEVGTELVAAQGRELRELQERLNSAMTPQSFATEATAHLSWDSIQDRGTLFNVLGLMPADSPSTVSAAEETLVLGAHRDHFGRQAGLLFAGADDNASGTAVMVEVARAIAASGIKLRRSILFLSFSGEEQNLLGSRLYMRDPVRAPERTIAMINVDHAGIGSGRLTVGVTGLSKDVAIAAGKRADVAEKVDVFGFFPGGDHVPFKEASVPTLTIVSGGIHPHYHQPSDEANTVQPDILEMVARYVLALVWDLVTRP